MGTAGQRGQAGQPDLLPLSEGLQVPQQRDAGPLQPPRRGSAAPAKSAGSGLPLPGLGPRGSARFDRL